MLLEIAFLKISHLYFYSNYRIFTSLINIIFELACFSNIIQTADSAYLLVSMHSKSLGMPSTCHKYVDLFCKGCSALSEERGEGILGEGGRYCADTRHGVSREGCFFEGWHGVPFPSSRWRFYNIHPMCTHVGMVILVPISPLSTSLFLSIATSKNVLRSRYRETTSLSSSYRSGIPG